MGLFDDIGDAFSEILPLAAGVGTGIATGNPLLGLAAFGATSSLAGGRSLTGESGQYTFNMLPQQAWALNQASQLVNSPDSLRDVEFGGNEFKVMPRYIKDMIEGNLGVAAGYPSAQYEEGDPGLFGTLLPAMSSMLGMMDLNEATGLSTGSSSSGGSGGGISFGGGGGISFG